jgi:beta-lactamase regulating signal transducer with metallopeptidase domain
MSAFIQLYPGNDAVRLAASVAVQIAIMVGLALIVSSTVARRNAALRHGIWLAALAWVCVAPIAAWALQRAGITVWRTPPQASIAAQPIGRSSPLASGVAPTIAVRIAPSARAETASAGPSVVPPIPMTPANATEGMSFEAFFGAVTAVWAAGALLLLSRLVWGLRVVTRLRRDLSPFGNLPERVANRLRMTLGIEILPPIMLSKRAGGPATIGIWRPVVVLPAALAATMSADELHDALAHECAHALRHDARIALVQQFAAAFYWIHPLVHVLNRYLARAREEVCDNVALAGTSPTEYARTLLALSQSLQATRGRIAVVQMFDGRWRLAQRVEGLLNTRRIVMTRMNRRTTALVAAMALALGTALAAITTAGDQTEDVKSKPTAASNETSAAGGPREDVDVRAAKAAAGVAKYTYMKNKEAYDKVKNSIPLVEVKRLEAAYQLAVLQVEQAERRVNKLAVDTKAAEVGSSVETIKREQWTYAELADRNQLRAEDERYDSALEEPRFEERKAELDVREAKIVFDDKKLALQQSVKMQASHAISQEQFDQAKLSSEIAEIELERAQLGLERAHAKVEQQSPGVYVIFPGTFPAGSQYSASAPRPFYAGSTSLGATLHDMTVKKVLKDHRNDCTSRTMRFVLIRFKGSLVETLSAADELKPSDGVPLSDLAAGKTKDEVVHHGDFIIVLPADTVKPPPPTEQTK